MEYFHSVGLFHPVCVFGSPCIASERLNFKDIPFTETSVNTQFASPHNLITWLQAQALLRKSIRDTALEAEADIEDPDKDHKDSGSDSEGQNKRRKGRGKGRGRGRGRGKGGKRQQSSPADALEEQVKKKKRTDAPLDMPNHDLPQTLEKATETAAKIAEADTRAKPDAEEDEEEQKEKKSTKASKKRPTCRKTKKKTTPKKTPKKNEQDSNEGTAANDDAAAAAAADSNEAAASDPEKDIEQKKTGTGEPAPSTPVQKGEAISPKRCTPKKTPKTSPKKRRMRRNQDYPTLWCIAPNTCKHKVLACANKVMYIILHL